MLKNIDAQTVSLLSVDQQLIETQITNFCPDPRDPVHNASSSNGGGNNYCGDGVITGAEECDDGNNADGDGCDRNCEIESDISLDQTTQSTGDIVLPNEPLFLDVYPDRLDHASAQIIDDLITKREIIRQNTPAPRALPIPFVLPLIIPETGIPSLACEEL